MIRLAERALAQRYAQAFLNVITGPFSVEECDCIAQVDALYRAMPTLLFYLQMPLFSYDSKKQSLELVRKRYCLPPVLATLDLLLLEQNRIFLLPMVYQMLVEQSHLRAGRVPCAIMSAQQLSWRERELCIQFVAEITGKQPLITWQVAPTLIAGLSIQTDTWIWENSLDARLRTLAQTLLT